MIKAIGFDFDGTLVLSESSKGPAMAAVFKEKFGISKGVRKAYEELIGKGFTRDEKVARLFDQFLDRKPLKKELKMVADHFGEHYVKNVATCPLIACVDVLKSVRKKVDFMFLLSLENQREVKKIAKHCGIALHFDEILGGPRSKVDNLKHVLEKHGWKASEMLYVGDAHSDVVATRKMKVKIALLGKKHLLKKQVEDVQADYVIKDLCDLEKIL